MRLLLQRRQEWRRPIVFAQLHAGLRQRSPPAAASDHVAQGRIPGVSSSLHPRVTSKAASLRSRTMCDATHELKHRPEKQGCTAASMLFRWLLEDTVAEVAEA